MRDFRTLGGSNLLDRIDGFYAWQNARRDHGLWPLGRSTESGAKPHCAALDDMGVRMEGVNFASQDYLGLVAHPEISAAAVPGIEEYGG
mgnify:CR=1 FL=1